MLQDRDLGIQRRHEEKRSEEIGKFVRYGYPWSGLSRRKQESDEFNDLRKPGWLPTAIVVNILAPHDIRAGQEVAEKDLITVEDLSDTTATIAFPAELSSGWAPSQQYPIEVIDGQHRLWAFEEDGVMDFELPVVAYYGLDISWQAYLFWTINIKPKRINTSLAFDLYPLLRTEDWLDRAESISIYRETRAQELTETLWAHPSSPWHQRINMLGEPGRRSVTQASWVRSLITTHVKRWEGPGVVIGGLFGAPVGENKEALPWSRAQQAAFLIAVWQQIREAIAGTEEEWATKLRQEENPGTPRSRDPAFEGTHSLLNTDQGVRGALYIYNDLCFVRADSLELRNWVIDQDAGASDEKAVTEAIESLYEEPVSEFTQDIAKALSTFDWRTLAASDLSEEQKLRKAAFRGTGGYRQLRRQLLLHLRLHGTREVSETADNVFDALKLA